MLKSIAIILIIISHLPGSVFAQQTDSQYIRRSYTTLIQPDVKPPTETTKKVKKPDGCVITIMKDSLLVDYKKHKASMDSIETLSAYIKLNADHIRKDGVSINFYSDSDEARFEQLLKILKENNIYRFYVVVVKK